MCESAGFQVVEHLYRIVEQRTGLRMRLVSEARRVRLGGLLRGRSRSQRCMAFADASGGTALRLSLRIVFPNALRHFLARLVFTAPIWRAHARRETAALARIMGERRGALA